MQKIVSPALDFWAHRFAVDVRGRVRLASLPPFGLGLVHLTQVVRLVCGRHENAVVSSHVLDGVALSGMYFFKWGFSLLENLSMSHGRWHLKSGTHRIE